MFTGFFCHGDRCLWCGHSPGPHSSEADHPFFACLWGRLKWRLG